MYYFASDMHLGLGSREESLARERLLIAWLERVSADAKAIFLVGDVFDFWYEYRRVVPKGFTRLLGALAGLTDRGVEIHFFPGNHDMWVGDYLEKECGLIVHQRAEVFDLYGKKVYVGHGDDVTARRSGFWTRMMNGMFRSRAVRWIFSHFVHPNSAVRFGQRWSSHSRKSKEIKHTFMGEGDPMVQFAREYSAGHDVDLFMFGHNHCAEIYSLNKRSTVVFLGEWIESPVYAALSPDGKISLNNVNL